MTSAMCYGVPTVAVATQVAPTPERPRWDAAAIEAALWRMLNRYNEATRAFKAQQMSPECYDLDVRLIVALTAGELEG